MRHLMILAGIICVGAGAYLCHSNNREWGWFLFVGFLILGSINVNVNTKESKEE